VATTFTRLLPLVVHIVKGYAQPPVGTIGENLRRVRGKRPQKAIAERLGVKQSRLSNLEKGRYKTAKLTTLLWLAKGYQCRVEDLIVGIDPEYDAGDLSDHSQSLRSPLPSGGAIDPAVATRALEERDQLRARLSALTPIVRKLFAIVVEDHLGGKSSPAATPRTRRGGRHRAAG
jgi:transcriptional regulator with XRE-family HTH domain